MNHRFEHLISDTRLFASVAEVDSTMNLAASLVDSCGNLEEPLRGLVMAESQSAGRGRGGRSWFTAPESFMGTFIFSVSATPGQHLGGLALLVGVWLAELLESLGGAPRLKWPNDIVTQEGQKLGGMLVRVVSHAEKRLIYIGIGINLRAGASELSRSTGVLAAWQVEVSREQIAEHVLKCWIREGEYFGQAGFKSFRTRWLRFGPALGGSVGFKEHSDHDLITHGSFRGLGDDGALLLEVDGVKRTFSCGEEYIPS